MRRLKLTILSITVAGAMSFFAPPAQAGPPEHCDSAGDLPDLCVVVHNFCQSQPKLSQVICD